ncbi:MAG: flavin reductase family protein [Deltaproteobacteria bacterium]|nr:flavin reductase family protein [Deltaproteobacteria bacterium]
MNKQPVDLAQAYRLINPGPVTLISVGDGAEDNLFAAQWCMPVRVSPPLLGILVGKDHYSWPILERTGTFGLNIPDEGMVDAVLGCGRTSGRNEADKFSRFGLTRLPAQSIRAPLVAQCVANLECRVAMVHDMGAQALVVAQVIRAIADVDHFRDGAWQFDRGLTLLHHLGASRFGVLREVIVGKLDLSREPGA